MEASIGSSLDWRGDNLLPSSNQTTGKTGAYKIWSWYTGANDASQESWKGCHCCHHHVPYVWQNPPPFPDCWNHSTSASSTSTEWSTPEYVGAFRDHWWAKSIIKTKERSRQVRVEDVEKLKVDIQSSDRLPEFCPIHHLNMERGRSTWRPTTAWTTSTEALENTSLYVKVLVVENYHHTTILNTSPP